MILVRCAFVLALAGPSAAASAPTQHERYDGWLKMYDLKFEKGPASNAAAYLSSKVARLGALESELFVHELAHAERLADAALQKSGTDSDALFVKSLALGLRADNTDLVEKQSLAALSYTKESRVFAEKAIQAKPPTRTSVRVWRIICWRRCAIKIRSLRANSMRNCTDVFRTTNCTRAG
jgi:hypothetical protein